MSLKPRLNEKLQEGQPCLFVGAFKFQSSEPHLQALEIIGLNMKGVEIGFPPIKIDSGEETHIITGVSGELMKIDRNLQPIGNVVKPFPAPITSSEIIGKRWVGIWIEREIGQGRMAALNIDEEWFDGESKAELRISNGLAIHPNSNIWSQYLDTEPTALSEINDTICFASNKGIYRIDVDSKEIWRSEHPKWEEIKLGGDQIIGFADSEEGLIVISQAGGVAIFDEEGVLKEKRVINLPELITGFVFEEGLGLFLKLNGTFIATMENIRDMPVIYHNKGPVYHAISRDSEWIWTGWRHDGKISSGNITTKSRDDIGIGIIGDNVLTNNGEWDKIRI